MVAADGAVAKQGVEQIGHLLKSRGHFRVVTAQMHIVEDDIDDALDLVPGGLQFFLQDFCNAAAACTVPHAVARAPKMSRCASTIRKMRRQFITLSCLVGLM